MTKADILGYRVMLLEREGRRFKPASAYPARAVACVTTHDLPPLAGWWEGADVKERASLGQLSDEADAIDARHDERAALVDMLTEERFLESAPHAVSEVVRAAHAFIATTHADLMLVQTDDLSGQVTGVNLPGTDTERPNWRLRSADPVATLLATPMAQSILDAVRSAGRRTDGASGDDRDSK